MSDVLGGVPMIL